MLVLTHKELPRPNSGNVTSGLDRCNRLLFQFSTRPRRGPFKPQAWISFLCETLSDCLGFLAQFRKSCIIWSVCYSAVWSPPLHRCLYPKLHPPALLPTFTPSSTIVFPHFLECAIPGTICLDYSFFLLYLPMSNSSFRHPLRYHFWKAFSPKQRFLVFFFCFVLFLMETLMCSNRYLPGSLHVLL